MNHSDLVALSLGAAGFSSKAAKSMPADSNIPTVRLPVIPGTLPKNTTPAAQAPNIKPRSALDGWPGEDPSYTLPTEGGSHDGKIQQ